MAVALALVVGACGASGGEGSARSTTTSPAASTTAPGDGEVSGSGGTVAEAWGADAQSHRGDDGETFTYECPAGGQPSTIWGTETYTDDSSVCTAAVHVGLITVDEGGEVTIEIGPGQNSYEAGVANEIESIIYGKWPGSFSFPDVEPGSVEFGPTGQDWGRSVMSLGLEEGEVATLNCTPDGDPASIWGTDTYTADSNICTAAVHAGLITLADGGGVRIEVTAGQDSYEGSEANGITSSSYGPYALSFTFPPA